jgi:hypothetical protein
MKESVANRRSLLGLLRVVGGFRAERCPLTILEPPLRSRRRAILSVRLVGLLMMTAVSSNRISCRAARGKFRYYAVK